MKILSVNNIIKSFGVQKVLNGVSFDIFSGDRIALVGNNGSGKTTLLNVITKRIEADYGNVFVTKDRSVGMLDQSLPLDNEKTLYEEVLTSFEELFTLRGRMTKLESEMEKKEIYSNDERLTEILRKYGRLTEEYEIKNGYMIDTKIRQVLYGLCFTEAQYKQYIGTFSGGEKTKIGLAKLLISSPDLLLLDEPTNHLDINTIEWLEGFLTSYSGAVLLVSHDREFMDRVVNRVFELKDSNISQYKGSYTAFVIQKREAFKKQRTDYINAQKEKKRLEEMIDNLKRQKKFSQIKNRERMLEKVNHVEKPKIDRRIKLEFKYNGHRRGVALKTKELCKSFENKVLFRRLNLDISWGEKVGIMGPNGTGKSTLLKVLSGLYEPTSGLIEYGKDIRVGFFDQEHGTLCESNTLLQEIMSESSKNQYEARSILARFMFYSEDVYKNIGDLSGGEKNRVVFAKLLASDFNLLIMDEPTNHLDINTREVLEEALEEYTGTLIFVSHDRYFVNRLASTILKFEEGSIAMDKKNLNLGKNIGERSI